VTRHVLRRCAPPDRYAVHNQHGATVGRIRYAAPGRWSYKDAHTAITITAPSLPQLRDEIRRLYAAR
jgi:hypothetical protein